METFTATIEYQGKKVLAHITEHGVTTDNASQFLVTVPGVLPEFLIKADSTDESDVCWTALDVPVKIVEQVGAAIESWYK